MIPGFNDSTLPTTPLGHDPFAIRYDRSQTTATTFTCDPWQSDWGTTVTSDPWAEAVLPAQPRTKRGESEELKAFKKAVARAALLEDQRALRTLRDDPSPRIPLQARKGLSGRQVVRKRVCAGSSRYRVLAN